MKTSFFVSRYTTGSYSLVDLVNESKELIDELVSLRIKEAREEFFDVLVVVQCLVYLRLGIDFEMILPLSHIFKYERRMSQWKKILKREGLVFSPRYLVNGSNHTKCHKVEAALKIARS